VTFSICPRIIVRLVKVTLSSSKLNSMNVHLKVVWMVRRVLTHRWT